ncbi:hypothetical protein AAEX28_11745 [Lentisphaerota bacterium WC36G]|nr:hypothetical protein LJT99_14580 [Lentisphaerae bacterium WC36]
MKREIASKYVNAVFLMLTALATNVKANSENRKLIAEIHKIRAEFQEDNQVKFNKAVIFKRLCKVSKNAPVLSDWLLQDLATNFHLLFSHEKTENLKAEKQLLTRIAQTISKNNSKSQTQTIADNSENRLKMYFELCEERRQQRLASLYQKSSEILYILRRPVEPSFYAYTEGQSDAQSERHFKPNSSFRKISFSSDKIYGVDSEILTDKHGAIRDIDVSYDGQKALFAWKKSNRKDDFSIYEIDFSNNNKITQLTGLGADKIGVADYEARYLPNGKIIFASSRCVQTVDCWKVEVSNLYTADADGKNIIRLGYDQVHTNYPTVTNEGTVIYTRWDYNDRGQLFPQPLFQMNPDGTNQTEFYGNNSYFPTVIAHARMLPNSHKVLAVLHGHHTWQAGKIAIIDREKGTQDASGVDFVSPIRKAKAVRVDRYGQDADLFRHPFPITNNEFITAYSPLSSQEVGGRGRIRFGLYYFDFDGNRELLVPSTEELSVNTPVPFVARKKEPLKPSNVDYANQTGVYYLHDVYYGPGLKGVKRGTIKKLRVVEIEYRAAYVGHNSNAGEAGSALVSTPVATGNGTWDPKIILGETPVYSDGSAMFKVPANTPVYFQCIDENGNVAATMRSWSTLMPNEYFSCIGCHENKNQAPPMRGVSLAMKAGAKDLTSFYNVKGGFSFNKYIQPILDKSCISCHNGVKKNKKGKLLMDLTNKIVKDKTSKRNWTVAYMNLTESYLRHGNYFSKGNGKLVNWITTQSRPSMLPPYFAGSAKSNLIKLIKCGHGRPDLNEAEINIISAWIDLGVPFSGDYVEGNDWSDSELRKYIKFQRKREKFLQENVENMEKEYSKNHGGAKLELPSIKPRYMQYLRK